MNICSKLYIWDSIRLVNDVQQIIDALSLLSDYKDICLFIYGNGDQRKRLVKYCEDREISNVVFKQECIPLSHVPYVMSHSNLNILNYRKVRRLWNLFREIISIIGSRKP